MAIKKCPCCKQGEMHEKIEECDTCGYEEAAPAPA